MIYVKDIAYKKGVNEAVGIINRCLGETSLNELNICVYENSDLEMKLGCCVNNRNHLYKNGRFFKYDKVIELSPNLRVLNEKEQLNTIVHEMLHALKECEKDKHHGQWLRFAKVINQHTNLGITATYGSETMNAIIKGKGINRPKYIIKCSCCGNIVDYKTRECNLIKKPELYRSNCCRANIIIENGR